MPDPDKTALRKQIRAAFPGAEVRREESECICAHVLKAEAYQSARTLGGYWPLAKEADIVPVLEAALRDGKDLLLPRVETEGIMTFRKVSNWNQLVKGSYGIPEPGPETEVADPGSIDLLLTPLEGIDRLGMRLGKGGGYYDRLLAGYPLKTLGIVLSHQWVSSVPHEAWDRPLCGAADKDGIVWFA